MNFHLSHIFGKTGEKVVGVVAAPFTGGASASLLSGNVRTRNRIAVGVLGAEAVAAGGYLALSGTGASSAAPQVAPTLYDTAPSVNYGEALAGPNYLASESPNTPTWLSSAGKTAGSFLNNTASIIGNLVSRSGRITGGGGLSNDNTAALNNRPTSPQQNLSLGGLLGGEGPVSPMVAILIILGIIALAFFGRKA